jgi:hypothetical protein
MHKREVKERIRSWAVLVLDEASMLSAEFFENVEPRLREVRGNDKPAGRWEGGGLEGFELADRCRRTSEFLKSWLADGYQE